MNSNVGGIDKLIRVLLSMVILGAGFYIPSWWGLIGLIPLLTAIMGFCPFYALLGLSTCRPDNCDLDE